MEKKRQHRANEELCKLFAFCILFHCNILNMALLFESLKLKIYVHYYRSATEWIERLLIKRSVWIRFRLGQTKDY